MGTKQCAQENPELRRRVAALKLTWENEKQELEKVFRTFL